MIPPVYIWKEFVCIDHLRDFQLNEFRQNRDRGKSMYRTFKGGKVRFRLLRLFIAKEPQKLDRQKYVSLETFLRKLFKITSFQTPWRYW